MSDFLVYGKSLPLRIQSCQGFIEILLPSHLDVLFLAFCLGRVQHGKYLIHCKYINLDVRNKYIVLKIKEIDKRRTFGIISHPDAGKTTLTEKLLLFGGAIQTAGAVKRNKIKNGAVSDFMEIERQRGISVATSVMGFEYDGFKINILDTPGHQDFAEDTFRTLTAVDSVILVIDSVKGVEAQTLKLMDVCRMRNTPVIIFINKYDRDGLDPFELLNELERELKIHTYPLTWPIGNGSRFKGVYNLFENQLQLFAPGNDKVPDENILIDNLDDPILIQNIGVEDTKILKEDVYFINGVFEPFNLELYREGYLAPVFFGSAINNFGIRELLDNFLEIAPEPQQRQTDLRVIEPTEDKFSGFIFKIHANLDPNHRNRIAFCRVVSGRFERSKFYYHTRLKKNIRFTSPTNFMANEKSLIEEAYPGDVVGLYDNSIFKIGDTLTEGEQFSFKGIPSFSPEIFKELINTNPLKTKQLEKGISQLSDEGVAQLFTKQYGNIKIVGTVGELQFDVFKFRLLHEYGAHCTFHTMNFFKAFWISSELKESLEKFIDQKNQNIVYDKIKHPVFMAESDWHLKITKEAYPEIRFHFTSDLSTG